MTRGSDRILSRETDLVEPVLGEQVGVARRRLRLCRGQDVAEGGATPQGRADQRPSDEVGDARQCDELVARGVPGCGAGRG